MSCMQVASSEPALTARNKRILYKARKPPRSGKQAACIFDKQKRWDGWTCYYLSAEKEPEG
jgi:hypothetical protein